MKLFSKILIIAFISISLQSISAQDHGGSFSADGVVTIIYDTPDMYFSGTGFFIDSHTLVTAFHVVDGITNSQGKVSDQLFIVHPETEQLIPVHSIQALDFINDIAVLHVSEYESPVYYELFEGSKESLSSANAYVFGRDVVSLYKLEGRLSSQDSPKGGIMETLSLFTVRNEPRYKLSGSPVFSMDNKVIGVYSGSEGSTLYNRAIFSDVQNLKELLSKPSLNCVTETCIQYELSDAKRSKKGQHALGVYHLNLFVRVTDHNQNLGHKHLMYYWLQKSAKQGLPISMYQLALLYRAVDQDFELFEEWMTKAAEHNYGYAQLELSLFLLNDKGNVEEGLRWAQKVADNGYFLPLYHLENLVKRNAISRKEYFYYLEDFSNRGDFFAQLALAIAFFEGNGVDVDTDKAMKFLLQSVEANNPMALLYLSDIYKEGWYGVDVDIARSHSLKQRAMELGF